MSFNLQGQADLDRALADLALLADGDTLLEALREGAKPLKEGVVERVPVQSGELRDSYRVMDTRTEDAAAELDFGSDLDYAEPVEVGTNSRAAKPHLRPALDEDQEAIIAAVQAELENALRRLL